MSSILEEIETKIAGLKTSTTKNNVGVVRETGDGVARIDGLSDGMLNAMIEFPTGVDGLALNLEQAFAGSRGEGPPRPRRQHSRPATLPQRSDQNRNFLSAREDRARRDQA